MSNEKTFLVAVAGEYKGNDTVALYKVKPQGNGSCYSSKNIAGMVSLKGGKLSADLDAIIQVEKDEKPWEKIDTWFAKNHGGVTTPDISQCPACGSDILDHHVMCGACGEDLTVESKPVSKPDAPVDQGADLGQRLLAIGSRLQDKDLELGDAKGRIKATLAKHGMSDNESVVGRNLSNYLAFHLTKRESTLERIAEVVAALDSANNETVEETTESKPEGDALTDTQQSAVASLMAAGFTTEKAIETVRNG